VESSDSCEEGSQSKSLESPSDSILIIDDDASFRAYVSALFTGRGIKVLEARCVRDAEEILQRSQPRLLIVDYKLPDVDGVTWIGQLRDRGVMIPIAFVSGFWCDPGTFNWLRNILRVSLVLQKPVSPEIFVEVIESILPDRVSSANWPALRDGVPAIGNRLNLECETLLKDYPNSAIIKREIDKLLNEPFSGEITFNKLNFLKRKLEAEQAICQARLAYIQELAPTWQKVTENLRQVKENPWDGVAVQEVKAVAHKIKGTSGSFDLVNLSKAAEQLERLVAALDPHAKETELEIIWMEIFRVVGEGELAIIDAESQYADSTASQAEKKAHILALTDSLGSEILTSYQAYAELSFAFSEKAAMTALDKVSYDAVLVAEPFASEPNLINLCRDLRLASSRPFLPLLLVSSKAQTLDPVHLSYAGFTAFLPLVPEPEEVEAAVAEMVLHASKERPRVLLVDDDAALTSYVARILEMEGYYVEALSEPIYVIQALERCQPEVVVLDVIMPGLSGYDVCREIRNHQRWHDIAILFLTAKSSQEGRALAFTAGGDDLIGKPVVKEELVARVGAYAEKTRLKQAQINQDQFTKLLTRSAFLESAQALLDECAEDSLSASFALVSIDGVEQVIEAFGIDTSQQILVSLGALIRGRFEPQILRCRWAERIFGFLMPDVDAQQCLRLLDLLNKEFSQIEFVADNGELFQVSLSFAAAAFPQQAKTLSQLKDQALKNLLGKMSSANKHG
jgi:diguanylate cyclase (GGDEF)-like protein